MLIAALTTMILHLQALDMLWKPRLPMLAPGVGIDYNTPTHLYAHTNKQKAGKEVVWA